MPGTLDQLRDQLRTRTVAAGDRLAREWERELLRTSPEDTGLMRQQTRVTSTPHPNGAVVTATVNTPYADMVAQGTRAHVITPRRPGGVLVFEVGGRTVFTVRVDHPGAKADDWWDKAIDRLPTLAEIAFR